MGDSSTRSPTSGSSSAEQIEKQSDSQRCTGRRHVRPPSRPGTPDHSRVNARFACRTAFMPDGVTGNIVLRARHALASVSRGWMRRGHWPQGGRGPCRRRQA